MTLNKYIYNIRNNHNNMKKILILFLFIMTLIPMVMATPSYYYKQYEQAEINVPCVDELEAPCNSSINCNLSITYSNGSILLSDGSMTRASNGYYSYLLSTTNNMEQGEYFASVSCTGGDNGFASFSYEVTSSGEQEGTTILYFILGIIILSGGIYGFSQYSGVYVFKFLSAALLMITGIHILTNGLPLITNTLMQNGIGIIILSAGFYIIAENLELLENIKNNGPE